MQKILRDEAGRHGSTMKTPQGVIHSFNGTAMQARTYLDEGFLIGLNAIVTFSSQYDDMVKSLPNDRVVLETDAPYLAPAPYRGKRNEPLYIESVGNYFAQTWGCSFDEVCILTTANSRALYSI
jgi:TatD DNase family protein